MSSKRSMWTTEVVERSLLALGEKQEKYRDWSEFEKAFFPYLAGYDTSEGFYYKDFIRWLFHRSYVIEKSGGEILIHMRLLRGCLLTEQLVDLKKGKVLVRDYKEMEAHVLSCNSCAEEYLTLKVKSKWEKTYKEVISQKIKRTKKQNA